MKSVIFLLLICLNFSVIHSQSTIFQVWNELGVSGKLTKDLSYGVDLTTRFGNDGLGTIFPQLSLKYKLNKYVRASVDYRSISKKSLMEIFYRVTASTETFSFLITLSDIPLDFERGTSIPSIR
jgi:hypothetical protein